MFKDMFYVNGRNYEQGIKELIILSMIEPTGLSGEEIIFVCCDFTKMDYFMEQASKLALENNHPEISREQVYLCDSIDQVLELVESKKSSEASFFIDTTKFIDSTNVECYITDDELINLFDKLNKSSEYNHSYAIILSSLDNMIGPA